MGNTDSQSETTVGFDKSQYSIGIGEDSQLKKLSKYCNDINVDETQIQFYRDNGYVVISGLLNEEQLEFWRSAVDNAVGYRGNDWRLPNKNPAPGPDDYYGMVFTQRVNLWMTDPTMREIVINAGKTIGKVACDLEGVNSIRLWHDQALIKEPFANPTSWHLDVPYWSFDSVHAISAWVALDDVYPDNGCMYFFPKTHKLVQEAYQKEGIFRGVGIGSNMGSLFKEFPEMLKLGPTISAPMKAGDFSLHSAMLAHSAQANMTPSRRRAMTFQMFPDGCKYNGKQNILTAKQVSKMKVGVTVLNDPDQNPVLFSY